MSSDPKQPELRPDRVAVLGLGVMGGSFARAVSGLGLSGEVVGWSPLPEEREEALAAGAVAEAPERWQDAVSGAWLTVLAMPLEATLDVLGALPEHLHADATVMDVASLKAPVADEARASGIEGRWVGAHPMVGSERSGFAASSAALYDGALVWIVAPSAGEERTGRVEALWTRLGASTSRTEAVPHDRLVALASHLPQVTANALAAALAAAGISHQSLGPGGRDMTRLAASSPTMWTDLLAHAPPELAEGIRALVGELEGLADLVERGELDGIAEIMERTRAWRGDR